MQDRNKKKKYLLSHMSVFRIISELGRLYIAPDFVFSLSKNY